MKLELKSVVLTVFLSLLAPSAALAGFTEIEKLEKKAKKFAVGRSDVGDKQKGLCVCLNDITADDIDALGIISADLTTAGGVQRVEILCLVARANPGTGAISGFYRCDEWIPLAK